MNVLLAKKIISILVKNWGVHTFCFCAGSRNAPFFYVLSQAKGLKVFSFFEERSAGFFALGCAKKQKRPVAVITTSGTAVAELLPAVIEAYYSDVPLVLITADRPRRYRCTGTPQVINQVGIFSHYVTKTYDIEKKLTHENTFPLHSPNFPCHINVCFDEPLLDAPLRKTSYKAMKCRLKPEAFISCVELSYIKNFFLKLRKPLFILSEIPDYFKNQTQKCLQKIEQPIYAEALSGLRESAVLSPFILKSGENFLTQLAKQKNIDSVVCIGQTPVTRFWRELDNSNLPVLSISDQPFSGLCKNELDPNTVIVSFAVFFYFIENQVDKNDFFDRKDIFKKDRKKTQSLQKLLKQYPLSQHSLLHQISLKVPSQSLLFLGNSQPIRQWGLVASYKNKNWRYSSHRGACGIDGLLSSFLGQSSATHSNWCIIGDLSFLYDVSALWILKQMPTKQPCFIVVINNGGGQIFSTLSSLSILFKKKSPDLLLNSHNLSFKPLADLWGLSYYLIEECLPQSLNFTSPALIELKTNNSQSLRMEKKLQKL